LIKGKKYNIGVKILDVGYKRQVLRNPTGISFKYFHCERVSPRSREGYVILSIKPVVSMFSRLIISSMVLFTKIFIRFDYIYYYLNVLLYIKQCEKIERRITTKEPV